MILGSHNSWTYNAPKKWWMYLIKWTAKCQRLNIYEQYLFGVRCFDLRIKFISGNLVIAHGLVQYDISYDNLISDLNMLNDLGNCYIRILHEERQNITDGNKFKFQETCKEFEEKFPNIKFFCGRNLVNWEIDYQFKNREYTIEDAYASVQKPNTLYAIWPWLYSTLYNKKLMKKSTDKDILLIDFVNYGN